MLTFNRSDPEPPPAPRDADKENAAPEPPEVAGKAALLAAYRKTGGRRDVDLSWTRLHELLRDAGLPARGATAVLAARFVDAGRRRLAAATRPFPGGAAQELPARPVRGRQSPSPFIWCSKPN